MKSNFSWTDDNVNELCRLWLTKLTATEIAKKIGAPSKSSVTGKAQRIGLPHRHTLIARPRIERVRKERKVVTPVPKIGKTLLLLRKNECRWPVEIGFCANQTDGRIYCETHAKISRRNIQKLDGRSDNQRKSKTNY